MGSQDGKFLILGQTVLPGPVRKGKSHQSAIRALAFKMDKDHLPLLEDRNLLRRGKILEHTKSKIRPY